MKWFALAYLGFRATMNNNFFIYELQFDRLAPKLLVKGVFLDRLESGFLLFETPKGLVRVELSLRQRIYLLWTFRNFRRLSLPLLNPRQRALVNSLFRHQTEVVSHAHNSSLVIGVVEKFVPPILPEGAVEVPVKVQMDVSPVQQPALKAAQKPAPRKDERQEPVVAQPAEIAPQRDLVSLPSPKFVWPKFDWFGVTSTKLTASRLATTFGALTICIVSVGAWHRMQAVPAFQAQNQTRLQQINMTAVRAASQSPKPAAAAGISTAFAPPAVTAAVSAAPEAVVMTATATATATPSTAAEVPLPTSTPVSAPIAASISAAKRAIRVHDADPTPNLPVSDQERAIQASRPPLRFAYPDYTDVRARGVVSLTVGVDSTGAVRTVRVVSGNRALAAAAIKAVRQWRYRPYLKDGQAIPTETNIVISFFSEDAVSMRFPPSTPADR